MSHLCHCFRVPPTDSDYLARQLGHLLCQFNIWTPQHGYADASFSALLILNLTKRGKGDNLVVRTFPFSYSTKLLLVVKLLLKDCTEGSNPTYVTNQLGSLSCFLNIWSICDGCVVEL